MSEVCFKELVAKWLKITDAGQYGDGNLSRLCEVLGYEDIGDFVINNPNTISLLMKFIIEHESGEWRKRIKDDIADVIAS